MNAKDIALALLTLFYQEAKPEEGEAVKERVQGLLWHGIRRSLWIIFAFTVLLFIDDVTNVYFKRSWYAKSFWNPYTFANHVLMLVGMAIIFAYTYDKENLDGANLSGNHPLNIGTSLSALGSGLEVFKTVRTLVLFEHLGPIILCVTEVMKDIVRVVAIYLIILTSFTICAWAMVKPFQDAHREHKQNSTYTTNYTFANESSLKNLRSLIHAYTWKIVYADDEGGARIKKWGGEDVDFSLQFSHFVINANWALYQMIVAILMLNVLVAIMCVSSYHDSLFGAGFEIHISFQEHDILQDVGKD